MGGDCTGLVTNLYYHPLHASALNGTPARVKWDERMAWDGYKVVLYRNPSTETLGELTDYRDLV